jgi:hypothetical protein
MPTLQFPQDLLRFLYWVFFKPITLDRYIHEIDPTLGRDPVSLRSGIKVMVLFCGFSEV